MKHFKEHMEHEYFSSLKTNGWNRPFGERMLDLKELNNVLGTDKILEQGAAFDPSKFEEPND